MQLGRKGPLPLASAPPARLKHLAFGKAFLLGRWQIRGHQPFQANNLLLVRLPSASGTARLPHTPTPQFCNLSPTASAAKSQPSPGSPGGCALLSRASQAQGGPEQQGRERKSLLWGRRQSELAAAGSREHPTPGWESARLTRCSFPSPPAPQPPEVRRGVQHLLMLKLGVEAANRQKKISI